MPHRGRGHVPRTQVQRVVTAKSQKADTILIQLPGQVENRGHGAMRMAAGLVGIATFGSMTYVIAILAFGIALKILQIHSISQSTFMIVVHVGMLAAAIAARFGWVMFRRDAFIHRIEAAWSSAAAAGVPRLNG